MARDALAGPSNTSTVVATDLKTGQHVELAYRVLGTAGQGSFGVVSRVELVAGGTGVYALKQTRQDRRFKNRELALMIALRHPNIVRCHYAYQEPSPDGNPDEIRLCLFLEYIPSTLYSTYRIWAKKHTLFPEILAKVYLFQLLRALAYLHAIGVCHRDLKPHNILVEYVSLVRERVGATYLAMLTWFDRLDRESQMTGRVVLIDFGSAKVLRQGEANVSYTCSRYYRAPELIFGSTSYDYSIDMWSVGCIFGELLAGSVFFPGSSGIDQLVEIIKVLGTPTREEVKMMNPTYLRQSFPQIIPTSFAKILPRASLEAISLLAKLLTFSPSSRLTASEALAHSFFDEIKVDTQTRGARGPLLMPNGRPIPDELFMFTREELSIRPDLNSRYIPKHLEAKLFETTGVKLDESFEPLDLAQLRIDVE
ncbi:hypothetical protein JCM10212_000214 [Sporobolomyces blumeae]